jgi:hypothetical protein
MGDARIEINGYASIYTYGKYLIIVPDAGYDRIKLIALRPDNNSIGFWKVKNDSWKCTSDRWIYNSYHDVMHKRLWFLSNDLKRLFFIDMKNRQVTPRKRFL